MAEVSREALLESLARQRKLLSASIVLTPVDSLSFGLADRDHTAFLHGLYLTDKVRDRRTALNTVIQFAGREAAAEDLAAIHRLLAETLGAAAGSLRLLAGLQAHAATFMSIARPGQTVLLLPEQAGGHFSTRSILRRLGLHTIDLPIDYDRLCIDMPATLDLVERENPDFIFVDRSEGLRFEDFSYIGQIPGPVKVFDASQCLTPIITGHYANPLDWGFDLMLFTLHKSFPGPQKAGIVSRDADAVWHDLLKGLSTFVSSSHAENSYLVALALLRRRWLDIYAERMFNTALALEAQLAERGVAVFPRQSQGLDPWPGTHHIWLRATGREQAYVQYEHLSRARILTNYRQLTYRLGYGLRLGTTFSSVAGLDVEHIGELADVMHTALEGNADDRLPQRVAALARSARSGALVPSKHWASDP